MPLRRQVRGFGMAVLGGTLAGASPALVLAVTGVLTDVAKSRQIADLWLFTACFGIIFAFGVVLMASIVIGLPLTLAFRKLGWESWQTYTGAGAMIGTLLAAIAASGSQPPFVEFVLVGSLCAASGAVTGLIWWRKARAPLAGDEV